MLDNMGTLNYLQMKTIFSLIVVKDGEDDTFTDFNAAEGDIATPDCDIV